MFKTAILVLALYQFAGVARAQPVDVVRVTVSPQKMTVNGQGVQSLHWGLATLPGPGDVLLTDQAEKDTALQAIASLPDNRKNCAGTFFLDGSRVSNSCSLISALSPFVQFVSGPFSVPPSASASLSPITIVLRGTWVSKPPAVIDSLCIVAATGAYNPLNCTDSDVSAKDDTLGNLAATYKLGTLPPQLSAIRIRLRAEDGSNQAVSQLQHVAVNAFVIARGVNALPGSPVTTQTALNLRQTIKDAYSIADSRWPGPDVIFGTAQKGPGYILTIQNLSIVSTAVIVLTRGTEVGPQTPAIEAALARRRHDVGCLLQTEYRRELSSIVGTIPTTDSAWQVAKILAKSDDVAGPVVPQPQPPSDDYIPCLLPAPSANSSGIGMEFTATRRAVVAELDADVNVNLQASPHGILSGTGQLSENHMLLQNSQHWADTGSLNLNGALKVQTANTSFGIGHSTGISQTLEFGFDVDALYLRDENQRYGYVAGPKFVDEEYGANPNVYLSYTRPASLYALSAVVKASLGEQLRHVTTEPPSSYPPFLDHGWVNGLDPTFSMVAGYDFHHSNPAASNHAGVGQIFVSTTGNFLAARNSSGSTFSFNRYALETEAELFFGVTGTNDFLARYGRGISAISAGAPLFELPQAGGPGNIRGIEQGEYVGRGIGFDQSELAVNAVSVWKWIHHKPAALEPEPDPAKSTQASNTSLANLGITGIFFGGIYDRARIGQRSALGDLLDLSHGFHGSGVEAEIRGLPAGSRHVNLNFIYSISPNSVLHHRGVFLTSVSLDF